MKLGLQPQGSAGFTLIEIVIASALMSVILVSAYACLSAGYASQKIVLPRTEIIQNARVAMALMAADLRAACSLSADTDFLGTARTLGDAEADNLDFATHNYTPRHPREGDYCQESFFLDRDEKTGQLSLFRRRNPALALDSLSGGSREEIARNVSGLKFEYTDGLDWYASWGELKDRGKRQTSQKVLPNLDGLPRAVRITLYLDSDPRRKPMLESAPEPVEPVPPLVFQTVVRLNLAEAAQGTAAGAGAAGGDASQDSGSGGNSGNN